MDTTAERIAASALRVLEAEGPAAVSMRRVAAEVGITPMAIYHHFPSREALLDAVTEREFGQLLGYLETHSRKGTVETRILGLLDGYVAYAFARPEVFAYVFSSPRAGARRYPKDFRARRSPTLNPLADLVREAMREGALRRDDVWEVALGLWAHVHGYVMLHRAGRFALADAEFRALLRRSLKRLVRGLAA